MSVTSAQVISLMENVLFETPAMATANYLVWTGQSQANPAETDLGGLAQGMAASPEFGIVEHVIGFYEAALDRVPTATEVAYYVDVAESGLTSAQVAQGVSAVSQSVWNQIATYFTDSSEFAHSGSAADPIGAFYSALLGRQPSGAETAYYQQLLNSGTSVSTVMQYIADSPEFSAHHAGDSLKLANFGVLMTEAAGTGVPGAGSGDAVLVATAGDPIIVVAQPNGANYASQPSYVTSSAQWGTQIGTTDNAVLTVDNPTTFGASVTSVAGAIAALESGVQAHHLAWGVYAGNTYVVESKTGIVGPTDTTVVELTGVHALGQGTGAGLIYVLV